MLRAANITKVYRQGTPNEHMQGTQWYSQAHALAVELDPNMPSRAAAVIAVLSPMMSWDRNVALARDVYAGKPARCLGSNANKAAMLMAGAEPNDVLSGPKVRAFWRAIANPNDPDAIVIDRHALSIAAGSALNDQQIKSMLRPQSAYGQVVKLYANAARIVNVSPVALQATTWVIWRRMKGIK